MSELIRTYVKLSCPALKDSTALVFMICAESDESRNNAIDDLRFTYQRMVGQEIVAEDATQQEYHYAKFRAIQDTFLPWVEMVRKGMVPLIGTN
jgi:hypothetical protein